MRRSSPTRWPGSACPRWPRKAGIHQRRTIGTGEGLPRQVVRRAPRHRDHRGIQGDRHPAVRAGRDPLRPGDPARNDLDLQAREIRIRGKGGTARTVKIGHQAARSLDRYLRARARHAQAWRPQLWLGVQQPGTADRHRGSTRWSPTRPAVRGGRVPAPVQAPFQPHLAGPRRGREGPDEAKRLGLPADAHPVRRQRPQRPRPPQLRPYHGRQPLTPAPIAARGLARGVPDSVNLAC